MKLESIEARMGHAPDTAVCTQGQNIQFNEKIMFLPSEEELAQIKASGGVLPDKYARMVAKNGCPQFVDGKCKLLGMAQCTR